MIVLSSYHRRVVADLTKERDQARNHAAACSGRASERLVRIGEQLAEIAELQGQLAAAHDAIGRLAVEADRQPVRGQGGRFAKRVTS